MDSKARIRQFMEPRSVALVGISSKIGEGQLNVLENLIDIGYKGRIYPVNPHVRVLLGHKVFPDVKAISEEIDLAVIMTPRHLVPGLLQQCIERRLLSILIVTQGFAEADDEGRALQAQLDKIIQGTGARILGPNSIGVINHFASFSTSFIPVKKEESPIAFISQSGGFLGGFPEFKIGKGIDLGNTSDVDFCDALDYFRDDPQISVIGLYVESIKNGRKFIQTVQRVAKRKLILALKGGKSADGIRAACSHSGALSSEAAVYEAAFEQSGAISIRSVEEFGDISKAFLSLAPAKGNGIGIITPSGAGGIAILDHLKEYGLQLADLSPETLQQMRPFFSPWQKITNPLDIMSAALAHGYKKTYSKALETLFRESMVDTIICVLGEPTLKTVIEVAQRYREKPVISWVIGPSTSSDQTSALTVRYPSPQRALRSVSALLKHHSFRCRSEPKQKGYRLNRKTVVGILASCKEHPQMISSAKALSILNSCGIPLARYELAETEQEAIRAAKRLGYPVVLKICSTAISHKSDVGGVRIGIGDAKQLKFHYEDMMAKVHGKTSGVIQGVMVQEMVQGGQELILGCKRSQDFGHVIVFGWGGIYTELLKDVSCGLIPLTLNDVDRMISSTKIFRMIGGFRGRLALDRTFIVQCILRISTLVSEFPEIAEMDLNPLVVFNKGGLIVDARIVVA